MASIVALERETCGRSWGHFQPMARADIVSILIDFFSTDGRSESKFPFHPKIRSIANSVCPVRSVESGGVPACFNGGKLKGGL